MHCHAPGLTLIELIVTLLILSILAAAALPYAELTVTRTKELELRRALRDMRAAIDVFHAEWRRGDMSKSAPGVSDDGFPATLQFLVDGVESSRAAGGKRRYLRSIPRDPFGDAHRRPEQQWRLRGYQDDSDALSWNGKDVYDIYSQSAGIAIDGSRYKDW